MAGLRCSLACTSSTLLLSVVVLVLALAAAPAQAWRNETVSVRRCNFTLSAVYQPPALSSMPPGYNNTIASVLFQDNLRQWMVDLIQREPENHVVWAIDMLGFATTLSGRIDSVVTENVTNGIAQTYVEGSFETEQWSCSFAVGIMGYKNGPLGRAVAASVDRTLLALGSNYTSANFSGTQFPSFFFNEYTAGERSYDVLVPTEEDLCAIIFGGSYKIGSRLDPDAQRPSPPDVFYEEILARVRLTYSQYVNFYISQVTSDNVLSYGAQVTVLKNESVGLTSLLAPAVLRTLERLTDAPYDSSELVINAQRSCYVPPPEWIVRCVQVSAKLESGAPFALNSSAVNSSATIFASFRNALNRALGDQSVVPDWNLQVQSVAAVPLEQADTLQVAVHVDFAVDRKDEARGVSMIGRQVTSALETTAVEISPSSLYEVAYTITPCHAPSSTFAAKRHAN